MNGAAPFNCFYTMNTDENLDQKAYHFTQLMTGLLAYERATGESSDISNEGKVCDTCGHPVCKMVQENNPPLLCYTTYGVNR